MPAEVETMFSASRTTPWHGLGTVIEEAPTSYEALRIAKLDWKVNAFPLFADVNSGNELKKGKNLVNVPKMFANVRDSDNSVLGVVSDQYTIVQNEEAFAFTDYLLGEGVTYETAGSLFEGKKTWLLANLPAENVLGDVVTPYLLFSNSFDGKGAVRIAMTPVRVVCQNTLNMALGSTPRSWSTKHYGNIEGRLEDARKTLMLATTYMKNFSKEAEQLATVKLTKNMKTRLISQLIPIPTLGTPKVTQSTIEIAQLDQDLFRKVLEQTPDLGNHRDTAWGFINAVSDFATHRDPLRKRGDYQAKLMMKTAEGHPMIDLAYELVRKVA